MVDDPINPKHYAGTACAEIGEHLSGNSYQVLKYNWRLGKKDTASVEVGKSLWYLDREIILADSQWFAPVTILPPDDWFHERYSGQPAFVQSVAINLINWNRYADKQCLEVLRGELNDLLSKLQGNS